MFFFFYEPWRDVQHRLVEQCKHRTHNGVGLFQQVVGVGRRAWFAQLAGNGRIRAPVERTVCGGDGRVSGSAAALLFSHTFEFRLNPVDELRHLAQQRLSPARRVAHDAVDAARANNDVGKRTAHLA